MSSAQAPVQQAEKTTVQQAEKTAVQLAASTIGKHGAEKRKENATGNLRLDEKLWNYIKGGPPVNNKAEANKWIRTIVGLQAMFLDAQALLAEHAGVVAVCNDNGEDAEIWGESEELWDSKYKFKTEIDVKELSGREREILLDGIFHHTGKTHKHFGKDAVDVIQAEKKARRERALAVEKAEKARALAAEKEEKARALEAKKAERALLKKSREQINKERREKWASLPEEEKEAQRARKRKRAAERKAAMTPEEKESYEQTKRAKIESREQAKFQEKISSMSPEQLQIAIAVAQQQLAAIENL